MELKLILCDPQDHSKELPLIFTLWNSRLAERWTDCLSQAIANYPIDDPQRFYGLDDVATERARALAEINRCIDVINADRPLIDRRLTSVDDTDTLNYLHHVFEVHHGLLDQQHTQAWLAFSPAARRALADLNIAVHRVESVLYGNKPRFTMTYFGLPKTRFLEQDDYRWLTNDFRFGGLYINYVEIGKTLDDLERDNDQYIEPDAFQPFQRYSADFTVKLHDVSPEEGHLQRDRCREYFHRNQEFFSSLGYDTYDEKLRPGALSIGQLIHGDRSEMLDSIRAHQRVKSVSLI
jgi:hypothetical protein